MPEPEGLVLLGDPGALCFICFCDAAYPVWDLKPRLSKVSGTWDHVAGGDTCFILYTTEIWGLLMSF